MQDAGQLLAHSPNLDWGLAELLDVELLILSKLDYNLLVTTPITFLARYLDLVHTRHPKLTNTAMYLAKLTLLKPSGVSRFRPSHIACAAIWLAHRALSLPDPWPPAVEQCTEFSVGDFYECAQYMWDLVHRSKDSRYGNLHELYSRIGMDRVTRVLEAATMEV